MLSRQQMESARSRVVQLLDRVAIALTPDEVNRIEVADFGLNDLERMGLQLLTYVNTDRVCAKELVLFPRQTCPEHFHPNRHESLNPLCPLHGKPASPTFRFPESIRNGRPKSHCGELLPWGNMQS